MQPISFTAASAEEAVAQIRERLGPDAVVLNVRPLPANGIARLWQKPMIEVLAYRPEEPAAPAAPMTDALAEFRQQLDEIKQQIGSRPTSRELPVSVPEPVPTVPLPDVVGQGSNGRWRIGSILQSSGLLPLPTHNLLDQLRSQHGETPPATLGEELALVRNLLACGWRRARPSQSHSLHVLVGPSGSGKTTCLCKWLTQATLVEGRSARVWRLDGTSANMAESLSVYCEILAVSSERSWPTEGGPMVEDIGFIDLPGVDWQKPAAIRDLSTQLQSFGAPQIHLVLNAAYDISILLAQVRAFGVLPVEDLIITHLDEEFRWGKIWNLALGTNYSIRHFSTGQNIPGDFCEASAQLILDRQFPNK